MFITGAGAEARNSIGIMLVTGMMIGKLFTLFILPAVYMLFAADHRPEQARDPRHEQLEATVRACDDRLPRRRANPGSAHYERCLATRVERRWSAHADHNIRCDRRGERACATAEQGVNDGQENLRQSPGEAP